MNIGNLPNDALAEFFSEAGVDYQALLGHETWWDFTLPRACISGSLPDHRFIKNMLKYPALLNIEKGTKLAKSMIKRAGTRYQAGLAVKFYDLLLADRLSKRDVFIITMALTVPLESLKTLAQVYFDSPILRHESPLILTKKKQRRLQLGAESKDWNTGKTVEVNVVLFCDHSYLT